MTHVRANRPGARRGGSRKPRHHAKRSIPQLQQTDAVLRCCLRRVCHWQTPPNWHWADWQEEARDCGCLAACRALRDYDSTRGLTLDRFMHLRVMATILTRYRQEWAYASHCSAHVTGSMSNAMQTDAGQRDVRRADMQDSLDHLSPSETWLLGQIFLHRRTESQLAEVLHISQQAVSKRKVDAMNQLRGFLNR